MIRRECLTSLIKTPHKPLSQKRMHAPIEPHGRCWRICYTEAGGERESSAVARWPRAIAWHGAAKPVQSVLDPPLTNYSAPRRRNRCVLKNSSPTAQAPVWRQQLPYRLKEGALIGLGALCLYLCPLLLGVKTLQVFRARHQPWQWSGWLFSWRLIGLVFLVLSGAALAYIHFDANTSMPASAGGALGESLGQLAVNALNVQGSTLLLIALFLFGLTVFTDLSWFKMMDLTGKITLDLIELIQNLANRWWSARIERKQLVAQLREVDERVSEVSAPIVLDRREQAKVKERLIEREESLNKHMSERVNRPAPVITPPAAPKAG